MASTGLTLPGSGTEVSRSGSNANWSYEHYITYESDGYYARAYIPDQGTTHWLKGYNFGFSIPGTAVIDGIVVRVRRRSNTADMLWLREACLVDASGNIMRPIRRGGGYFQTTWGEQDVGGATDRWCVGPTPSMVNDSDFGVVICVDSDDDANYNYAYVSWIKINIYYTEGRSQSGPAVCGTGANEDRDGMDAWTNPANIQTDDENYAYCDVPKNEYTDWLRASQFGFSIPGGSTIHGIIVCARCRAQDYWVRDSSIRLVDDGGSNVGDDKANSLSWLSYYGGNGKQWGGSQDTWNASPTPSMVNDSDFGVRISAYNGSGVGSRYAYVYWVKITIFYTGAVEHYKTLTESLGLVDTAVKGISIPKVEAIALSDTVVKAPSLIRSELLGLVDGYSRVWAAYKVNAEALGLSDTVVKATALPRSEELGLADSVEAITVIVKVLTELLGLTDSVTKSPAAVRTELLGLLDTYSRVWQTHQTYTEYLGLLDSIQKDTAQPLTEIMGLADSLAKTTSVVKSESLGLSDLAIKDIARELVESLGLTDTVSTVKVLVKILTEMLGLTDALSCSIACHRTYTEALGLTDRVSRGVALPLSEMVALVDIYSRVWQTHQTYIEYLGLIDSIQKDTAHPLTEIVGLADLLAKTTSVVKSESLGLSDLAIKDIARELVESLGLTDTVSTVKVLVKILTELLGLTDALSRSIAYHRTYTEALGLTDRVSKGVALSLSEMVALVDAVGAMPNPTILANLIRKYIRLVDIGEGKTWVS